MKYNVLLIGSGGREHALAWKISQSSLLNRLYALPGNPGISEVAESVEGKAGDFDSIKKAVVQKNIDLVVVGPEDPLVNGLRDFLEADEKTKSVLFTGPGREGARLEGSKEFAKEFMKRHSIPTAAYRTFSKDEYDEACRFIDSIESPYVLKADGLAAGKGVLIIEDAEEAKHSLAEMYAGKFGSAGNRVVIEQFLSGVEVSYFVLTDGKDYLLLPEAKDYKRVGDGDKGLNTGGMGAVSPVPFADEEFTAKVKERIIVPTIEGLREEGIRYNGFIFLGLMNCGGDPFVIEYNVRMGDPETEAVMTRIDSDLLSHLIAAARGDISGEEMKISSESAVTGIIASGGYPEHYAKGFAIEGLENVKDAIVFQSGTSLTGGKTVTSGGRVLAVTANGSSLTDAREKLYKDLEKIKFDNCYHRNDIALDIINYKK